MKGYTTGDALFEVSFIRGYSLAIFLGVIVSFLTVAYFWKRHKYPWELLQILVIIVVPSGVLGSKFYTMIVDSINGKEDVWTWSHFINFSGLSIYGAVIFATITGSMFIYSRRHIIDFRTVLSMVVPAVLAGQAIGRWGNFMNHEVYGGIVDGDSLNWLGSLKEHMLIDGHYRAPIFLYEFIASTVGYFLIIWVFNRKSVFKPGATVGVYFIWYGIERLILQTFRDSDERNTSYINGVQVNLVISIIAIIAGAVLFVWWHLLTPIHNKFIKRILPKKFLKLFKEKYEIIYPVKPRRPFFFGEKTDKKGKYFIYFGKEVDNIVKLYIPIQNKKKWSKREINRGKRNK